MNSKKRVDILYHFGNLSDECVDRFERSVKAISNTQHPIRFIFSDAGFKPSIDIVKRLNINFSYHFEKYESPYNRSLTINNGFRHLVKSDFVMFMDIDMVVQPMFLDKCVEIFNKENKVLSFNYKRLCAGYPKTTDYTTLMAHPKEDVCEHNQSSLLFMPTKTMYFFNGLDEEYVGWGAEDTDLNHRLRKNNNFYFCKDIIMLHQHHKGKDNIFKDIKEYKDKNVERYIKNVKAYNEGKKLNEIKGIIDLRKTK